MLNLHRQFIQNSLFVILLTLQFSCALLSSSFNPQSNSEVDPITRTALQNRTPQGITSEQEKTETEMKQSLQHEAEIQTAINLGEITLGMTTDDVLSAWGQPRDTESAGRPDTGNQKWIYVDALYSPWNLKPSRIVYFERGRVVGWETRPL